MSGGHNPKFRVADRAIDIAWTCEEDRLTLVGVHGSVWGSLRHCDLLAVTLDALLALCPYNIEVGPATNTPQYDYDKSNEHD